MYFRLLQISEFSRKIVTFSTFICLQPLQFKHKTFKKVKTRQLGHQIQFTLFQSLKKHHLPNRWGLKSFDCQI